MPQFVVVLLYFDDDGDLFGNSSKPVTKAAPAKKSSLFDD